MSMLINRKISLILILLALVFINCTKNDSTSNDSGSAVTSDNENKTYMEGLDLKTFSGYIDQSYATVKSDLDQKYKDTAFVVSGEEELIVYIQDTLSLDRFYALIIYGSNGGTIGAVDVQNISDITSSEIWTTALNLADSTQNIAGQITVANVYNSSYSVYETTSLDELLRVYTANNTTYNSYTAEIDWNNSVKSYAVIINSGLFYWIAQKGDISTTSITSKNKDITIGRIE